ncbi:MAG: hypothetical protein MK052_00770 [Alphaproteobacteria bacterium]|nr:hypothetical protein [Alphaproteobacteria bacterium]
MSLIKRFKGNAALLLIAAFFIFANIAPAHSAWTREKGTWFSANSINYYSSNNFIDDNGNAIAHPNFTKWEWNGYVEYGLEDDTTLGGNAFIHAVSTEKQFYTATSNTVQRETATNYGLADTEFFIRHRLWQGTWLNRDTVISVQPLIKLPSFYADASTPRSGTDNFDAELKLQLGYNFTLYNRNHFVLIDLAYRKRFGDWKDQLKSDATLGLTMSDNTMLLLQNFTTLRAQNDNSPANPNTLANDYDLVKSQASLVYRFAPNKRIQFGGFMHTKARNTGSGEGVIISLWQEF